MRTIIEVGANDGTDTIRLANENPDAMIYSFEPTKELLVCKLWPTFTSLKNVRIIPFAVDTENGFKKFNVSGIFNWGCSSLNDFSDDIHKTWPGRADFSVTHAYEVQTITLFDFCKIYNIGEIDYLWIDAQGHDFKCLQSLGDKIKDVKSGRCEVSNRIELYKNTNNSKDIVKPWLESNGFNVEIHEATPDPEEIDLIFTRK